VTLLFFFSERDLIETLFKN